MYRAHSSGGADSSTLMVHRLSRMQGAVTCCTQSGDEAQHSPATMRYFAGRQCPQPAQRQRHVHEDREIGVEPGMLASDPPSTLKQNSRSREFSFSFNQNDQINKVFNYHFWVYEATNS
jgi:hypothetical protein